jgi:hypothetical protein
MLAKDSATGYMSKQMSGCYDLSQSQKNTPSQSSIIAFEGEDPGSMLEDWRPPSWMSIGSGDPSDAVA